MPWLLVEALDEALPLDLTGCVCSDEMKQPHSFRRPGMGDHRTRLEGILKAQFRGSMHTYR